MEQTITQKTRLPLVGETRSIKADIDVEAELKAFEEAERERLGLKAERRQWVDGMLKPKMTKKERENVTLLISGLTAAQDFLCEGALKGLGYNVHYFGISDNAGLQTGKEFGNRGQCNPTYFTVGGLVKHLIDLRDKQGMKTEDIIKNYVFLTAGACGPCRFGMYVTEYRKALRDAGFDGFRVMLFQQTGGLSQATGDDVGLEMNPAFFIAIIKAIVCGDTLNALAYRIRPYEVEPGATNRAMESAKRVIYKALYEQTNVFKALYEARKQFEGVRVDKLRPKAKTSIIGEFWAMTTEGDGNYALQKFLESEGGENDIQLTTAWLLYNIWECARDTRERRDLRGADEGNYGLAGLDEFGVAKRLATMRLAEGALRVGFQAFALPLGLFDYHLPDMDLVADVAKDYYSNDLRGGEGHMEVGKLIVNAVKSKAHLTVSVKPFGCMPSSGVSDGVQSLITARYPGTIFCAVETSGDGATNFYSRIQMYMFKARILAEEELARAYQEAGVTEAEVRAFLEKNPKYASPLHHAPHRVAGSAANLVYEVAPLIRQSAAERAAAKAKAAAGALRDAVKAAPAKAKAAKEFLANPETIARAREDVALIRDIVRGKAAERFSPLVKRLAGKAYFENNPEAPSVAYHGEPIAAE
ncbi:2-hydroxyglutaryl-CoA dehydratase [Sorangium cellulosum]|uniref:2-hydroxyglutaryl-CoA dehydratase n=1 Tax=Sorangium cellulosum TaxID=56 RepID=A0A2L0F376_SORCE|nr:2-hydroxyglutaryl-CoA dehydratase [Sorangium cellulosum]AUX46038.1 2-hydroxyglutaryl-CoA dehydratase [Sorangium cellulosum]